MERSLFKPRSIAAISSSLSRKSSSVALPVGQWIWQRRPHGRFIAQRPLLAIMAKRAAPLKAHSQQVMMRVICLHVASGGCRKPL
jgi:hypothetical protein